MSRLYLNHSSVGEGYPLIVIHGLFGSSRNWQALSKLFARSFRVITVDLRNHGDSFHAPEMGYALMAGDVLDLMDYLAIDSAHILGHSMGGKLAMQLAQMAPERVNKLVVADIAPVTYGHSYHDIIAPVRAMDLSLISSRKQADSELEQGIPDQRIRQFIMQNLSIQDGKASWKLNWEAIQNNIDTVIGYVNIAHWSIHNPTLFIRGGASGYVTAQGWALIQQHFLQAELITLDKAGHWLHAEQPAAFAEQVVRFLQR
ncbi:MAG: alpha/beta fold hydrolase [Gammaproteobacteria bacterium]|nr:alpha/beta fold hydrolase [Gammaproteobacteria bacterium]MBL6998342.1 alpha/beta fold hydrolase [Gammaproteobacteria bacterium]